jgi:asparagine synthase (glutamine-hydrolysing)
MCGIGGAVSLTGAPVPHLDRTLAAMDALLAHRGPDGSGAWRAAGDRCGLVHRRLAITDLSAAAAQPMRGPDGAVLVHNGEVYNFIELARELRGEGPFRTRSDAEAILAAYRRWGADCLPRLRGMFAFALWDGERLFAARDPFGIKPFYYAVVDGVLYFASEAKALLPFLPAIETDPDALADYLLLQYTLGDGCLFKHVRSLPPGHSLVVEAGLVRISRYWSLPQEIDAGHDQPWFGTRLRSALTESVDLHLRADVPVGSHLSGGLDSSLVATLAARAEPPIRLAFHGKFAAVPGHDESAFAATAARHAGIDLNQVDITSADFRDNIEAVLYHLDHPVAGPGSFAQFMVARLAARHVKVVLAGQGGDELFGGYARYVIARLEQCLGAAIEDGRAAAAAAAMMPNLAALREFKPLIRQFFANGMFGPLDQRYLRLIDRSADLATEVDWRLLDREAAVERYAAAFNGEGAQEEPLDAMMRFDFTTLLPALLQVEDRMSMAHGLETRVPMLDRPLVELAAAIPASLRLQDGRMKSLLRDAFAGELAPEIAGRRDKMGFPVPLAAWRSGELGDFLRDLFGSRQARERPFLRADAILAGLAAATPRKLWGLISLELWHRVFHDRAAFFRSLPDRVEAAAMASVLP